MAVLWRKDAFRNVTGFYDDAERTSALRINLTRQCRPAGFSSSYELWCSTFIRSLNKLRVINTNLLINTFPTIYKNCFWLLAKILVSRSYRQVRVATDQSIRTTASFYKKCVMCVKRDCLKRDYRDYTSVQTLGTKLLSTIFKTLLTICHVSLFSTARKNNLEII